jgi:EmrB/QacA subfamily drug resistance transporter
MSNTVSESAPYRWRWVVLAIVLAAEIMDLLDATISSIAAPSIVRDIGGGDTTMQWLAAAYTLAFAVGLITGGRLGDIYGRKRIFLIGAAGFTSMSALCAAAWSPGSLIAFRALQGGFGALMIPQGLGMIKTQFPPKEMATAFGLWGPIMALSSVGGPILGGFLVDSDVAGLGWRSVFLINVPIGIAAVLAGLRFMLESRSPEKVRLDLVGMGIVSIGMFALLFPLVEGREHDWPAWMFALMGAAVVVLAVFVLYERRLERAQRSPLVVTGLFRKPAFSGGLVVGLALFSGMTGLLFCMTLFLQLGRGFDPTATGLALIPLSIGLTIGAGASGAVLTAKFGRATMLAGLGIMAVGVLGIQMALHGGGDDVSAWALTPGLGVFGLGLGMMFGPFFDIVLAGVEDHEVGSASGTLNAVQQLGGSIGVAVLGTVFFSVADDRIAQGAATAFHAAIGSVFWIELGLIALTFSLTFLLPRRAREEGGEDATAPAGAPASPATAATTS